MSNYNNLNSQIELFSNSPIENYKEDISAFFIIKWVFQILLWIDLLLIIIIDNYYNLAPKIVSIFIYIIYLILEFNSPIKELLYSLYEKSFYEEFKKNNFFKSKY